MKRFADQIACYLGINNQIPHARVHVYAAGKYFHEMGTLHEGEVDGVKTIFLKFKKEDCCVIGVDSVQLIINEGIILSFKTRKGRVLERHEVEQLLEYSLCE